MVLIGKIFLSVICLAYICVMFSYIYKIKSDKNKYDKVTAIYHISGNILISVILLICVWL